MNAALALDRARLLEVESEIQKLEPLLAALRSEKENISRRLDEYMYPVLTLPNEITGEIFVHYLPPYPAHPSLIGPGSPTYLLGICRLWRNIALHIPALWRSIRADDGDELSEQDVQLVKAWIQRSGVSPLSLQLDFETFLPREVESSLLQAVVAQRSRWEYIRFRFLPRHFPSICGPAPRLAQMILSTPWDDGTEAVQSISLGDTHLLRAVYLWNVRYDVSSLPWDQLTSLALRPTSFIECAPILQLATHLRSCKLFMHASGTAEGTHLQLPRLEFLSFIITTSTVDSDLERTGLDALTLPSLRKLELSARFLGGRGAERLKSLISRSRSEGLLERLRIVSKSSRRSNSDELDACRVTFPLVDIDKIDHWRIRHEWQLEKAEYWDHATTGSSRGSTTDDSVVLESD